MKLLVQIVLVISLLGVITSNDQHCQMVLNNIYKQSEIVVETYKSQDYSKLMAETYFLSKVLTPVSEYCPTLTSEQQILKLHAPFDCKRSMAILTESLEEDIVSKFQIIKEITEFQTQNCLPYDFEFELGIKALIEKYINTDKQYPTPNVKKGLQCALCGGFVTLMENYIDLHDLDISEFIGNKGICKIFSGILETLCDQVFDIIGPIIVEDLTNGYNSDVICDHLGACTGFEQCKLHPDSVQNVDNSNRQNPIPKNMAAIFDKISPNNWLQDLIEKFADEHLPILDYDGDRFSDIPTLRGYDWRGEDCQKFNKKVYPGRKTVTGSKGADYNCNGISGSNPDTGVPYKTEYCDGTGQLGTILFGDSAGAHFSIPGAWLNVTEWGPGTFSDVLPRLANELDLPQKSGGTGFQEQVDVNSFYLKLLERNRCNRNDYQNTGVNGAKSTNEMKNMLAVARDQTQDFPAMIFWELIGNDVCGSTPDHMTEPDVFREKIIELWEKLDTIMPAGSHMVVTGVADGRVLYECLSDRLQPIGVPYPVFYEFLNCLQISPCAGWMNTDPLIRDATTARANELNQIYQEIIVTHTFQNFDIQYYDLPIKEIMQIVEDNGGTCADAIEPVDGFHPSQIGEALWADILWKNLDVDQPTWKGEVNPNNEQIINQFGNGFRFSDRHIKPEEILEL